MQILALVFGSIHTSTLAYQGELPRFNLADWVSLLILLLVILVVAWRMIDNRGEVDFPVSHHEGELRSTEIATLHAESAQTEADDLARIEGIGPKITKILQANGIATFAQLAGTRTEHLQEILRKEGLRIADPTTWPEQAHLAANGDWGALEAMQLRLKAGRRE
jgi:hypothetical protein